MDDLMKSEAESITNILHPKFKYVYIPECIDDEVQELTFQGKEKNFQNKIKQFFNADVLNKNEKKTLLSTLSQKTEGKMNDDQLDTAVQCSYTYQIIPLTLPNAKTKYEGINAYIDNIGRIKNLNVNSRASRVCSQDIRGSCFLSKTFDDENEFKRIDFTKEEYESFLKNPPSAEGRWSETEAMNKILQNMEKKNVKNFNENTEKEETSKVKRCESCRKEDSKLKLCNGCSKVFYCNVECQKSDWRYHKLICRK